MRTILDVFPVGPALGPDVEIRADCFRFQQIANLCQREGTSLFSSDGKYILLLFLFLESGQHDMRLNSELRDLSLHRLDAVVGLIYQGLPLI